MSKSLLRPDPRVKSYDISRLTKKVEISILTRLIVMFLMFSVKGYVSANSEGDSCLFLENETSDVCLTSDVSSEGSRG